MARIINHEMERTLLQLFIREADDLITQKEAARIIGITQQAIFNAIEDGRLPSVHVAGHRLVRRADVLDYCDKRLARQVRGLPTFSRKRLAGYKSVK